MPPKLLKPLNQGSRAPKLSFPSPHPNVKNIDGKTSNVKLGSFSFDGRHYALPTMVGGKLLSPRDAINSAKKYGLHKYPSFDSVEEAEAWIEKNHGNIGQ